MGRPKALLTDSRGRTFLARLVRTFRAGGCDVVVVVVGRHARTIAAQLPAEALLALNAGWEEGMLSSARVGLRAALATGAEVILLQPVDQPLVSSRDVESVLAAARASGAAVASHRGERGHPLGLDAETAHRVVQARGATLRGVVARHAPAAREVACSVGAIRGANTPAEARALFRVRPAPRRSRRPSR